MESADERLVPRVLTPEPEAPVMWIREALLFPTDCCIDFEF